MVILIQNLSINIFKLHKYGFGDCISKPQEDSSNTQHEWAMHQCSTILAAILHTHTNQTETIKCMAVTTYLTPGYTTVRYK